MNENVDDSILEIVKLFREITNLKFSKCQQQLRKLDLYPGQERIVYYLMQNNGLSQKELCKTLGVKPSTVTVMLKRMKNTGLFEKVSDENDKRVIRIFLTDKGKEVYKEINRFHKYLGNLFFEDISEEELAILKKVLIKIRNNLANGLEEKEIDGLSEVLKRNI